MSNCKRRVSIPSPQEIDPCDGTKYPTECVIESNALVNLGLPENSSQQEINLVLDTAIYNLSSAVTTPVQDKGTQVVDSPSALNFTGDAITVTDVGGVATINVSTLVPSSDYISNVELTGQNLVFTGIGNAFDSPVDLSSLDSTGYESVTEEGNTGLRRVGADVVNHGPIGNRALDLGYQTSPSATRGATGTGAINLGQGGTASGTFSFNAAISGIASNSYAVNLGQGGTASGVQSLNTGQAGIASGLNSINLLDSGQALGDYSINLVLQGIAASYKEIVLGSFPTNYTPNSLQTYNLTDRLLNIGIGINGANLADGVTILKNGQIGLGINNFEANSTGEILQVNGTVKATSFVGDGSGLTGLPSGSSSTTIKETFAGDGVTTSFVLSQTPNAGYTNQVFWRRDVLLHEGVDYTITGNTVNLIGGSYPNVPNGEILTVYYNISGEPLSYTLIDDDTFAMATNLNIASAESIKAYVDASGGGTVDVVSNVTTSTILGRVTAGSGDSEELTPTQVRTLLNVADGATPDQDLSGKQDNITLTTTGSSGAATLVGSTLNIPQYSGGALKHIELLGDGAALTYNIFHEKGTRSLHFSLFNITTGKYDEGDYTYVDDDNTLVTFTTAPTLNQYEISII